MDESNAVEDVWREVDYDSAWAPFNSRFQFKPDYHERTNPAIQLPPDSLVIDLSPIFEREGARFAAGEAAITASALRAFVWLAGDDELVALDWQHPAYRYAPSRQALSIGGMVIPVFPNGDYFAHMTPDLRWEPSRTLGNRL